MNWKALTQIDQLVNVDMQSHEMPVVIFKHSTTCSISAAAKSRLERNWNETEMVGIYTYYLDLLANRTTSNAVATHYDIEHESPQVLVIKKGDCVYNQSHMSINYDEVKAALGL